MPAHIVLTLPELRAVAGFASACAEDVLTIFEEARPGDPRPREALDAARVFAAGGARTKAQRLTALAAMRAARDSDTEAAGAAARAAMCAASAAYLHPLAQADQVKHILGAAAYATRAAELTGRDAAAPAREFASRATPVVVEVLRRYPAAPPGGGRVGQLIRDLDAALR